MGEAYRDVYHLSAGEMAELKESLYWGCCEIGNLSADEQRSVENAEYSHSISDQVVYHAFCGYWFCDEDFIR